MPELETPEQLRYFTRVNVSRGVDHIKTWATQRAGLCEQDPREPTYDVNQLRAIVGAAKPLPVMCHSHGTEGCQAAVEAGVGTLEHGTFVSERTLDLMARRGTYYDPTISAVVDLAQPGGEYTDPCLVPRGQEMLPVLKAAVRAAWERGVKITAGPDTSYSAESLSSIGGEVVLLNEAGVPALDAVRAATTTAARMVGLERLIGRVTRGYSADVIALDGSPLDDITRNAASAAGHASRFHRPQRSLNGAAGRRAGNHSAASARAAGPPRTSRDGPAHSTGDARVAGRGSQFSVVDAGVAGRQAVQAVERGVPALAVDEPAGRTRWCPDALGFGTGRVGCVRRVLEGRRSRAF